MPDDSTRALPPDETEVANETAAVGHSLRRRPGFLVRRLHQIHLALFAEECAAFEVTPVQYSLMTVLDERREIEQAAVAHEVGIDRATVADVLARLEKAGFVRRRPSRTDRRIKLVELTAKGRSVLRAMDEAAQRAHDRTIAALPEPERSAFLESLARLVDAGNDYGRAPMRLR